MFRTALSRVTPPELKNRMNKPPNPPEKDDDASLPAGASEPQLVAVTELTGRVSSSTN